VYKSGVATCPAGFANGVTLNESIADGRKCVGCTCAKTSTGCGTVTFYGTSDCSGTSLGSTTNGGPTICAHGALTVDYAPATPTCTVTDAGSVDDGGVTAVNPSTVCCAP
jgi:hypothetical protein